MMRCNKKMSIFYHEGGSGGLCKSGNFFLIIFVLYQTSYRRQFAIQRRQQHLCMRYEISTTLKYNSIRECCRSVIFIQRESGGNRSKKETRIRNCCSSHATNTHLTSFLSANGSSLSLLTTHYSKECRFLIVA
jgi:hypothetical protein